MDLQFVAINYWAVLVAAVVTFLFGGLWYTALFGRTRQRLCGYSDEKVKEMQAKCPPPIFFSVMFLCYLIVAMVAALLVTSFDLRSVSAGLGLGLLLWLGPAAAIGMTGHIASDKPIGVYLIDASFQLVFLVFLGILISVWR